jgi:hypothetical protein
MRTLTLTLLLAALGATPSAAQGGRVSFELAGGPSTTSAVFEQQVVVPAGTIGMASGTSLTRLSIDDAGMIGGRIAYQVTGPWTLVGQLGQGSTGYHYYQSFSGTGGVLSTQEQWGTARRSTFALGIARRSTLAAMPLFIEPELGIAVQRLRVGNPGVACVPTPPSLGAPTPCLASARWERTYSVPSVGAGLSLGYAIAPRVAVQLRGQYSVGRTSTKEAFYVDLLPQYDFMEAPTSQTVRSSHLSVGLRVAP